MICIMYRGFGYRGVQISDSELPESKIRIMFRRSGFGDKHTLLKSLERGALVPNASNVGASAPVVADAYGTCPTRQRDGSLSAALVSLDPRDARRGL